MKNRSMLFAAMALSLALSGCATYNAAQDAFGLYQSAQGVTSGYHAYGMVKDVKNAKVNFRGYQGVVFASTLSPRDESQQHLQLQNIFTANMAGVGMETVRAMRAPLRVCPSTQQCPGRVMSVAFKEDAYDRNLIQKLTVGNKLRGTLVFTEASTGQVIDQMRMELAGDYFELAQQVNSNLIARIGGSFLPQTVTPEQSKELDRTFSSIPAVLPQYEKALKDAS